jgi:hypothetical protein
MKLAISLAIALAFVAAPTSDPCGSLTQADRSVLKPQIERWIHDQVKHDWSDMWEIQDQTPEFKNELLLGRKDAPDMDRQQYIQAMQATIGSDTQKSKRSLCVKYEARGMASRFSAVASCNAKNGSRRASQMCMSEL